jgi:LysR family transcriptional activator of glutamate synthase operon
MHIHSMEYFLAIVDYNSFTQAALEKNISQSSLSKHIKNLEDEFQVTLFDRNTHKLQLTKPGVAFAAYAENIVREYNLMSRTMEQYREGEKYRLKISCVPIMHLYNIANMILSYRKIHPLIQLQISESPFPSPLNDLDRRNTDLSIVRPTVFPHKDQYLYYPLIHDELKFVCNRQHRLARKKEISLNDVAGENFVLLKPGVFDYVDGLKKQGYDFDFEKGSILLHNHRTIVAYIMEGQGVSLLMGGMAEVLTKEQPGLVTIPFKEHPPFPVAIVVDKQNKSKVAAEFIEYARDFYADKIKEFPNTET